METLVATAPVYIRVTSHERHGDSDQLLVQKLIRANNNKSFKERQHTSAPRSVNEKPIHGPTSGKL